MSESFKIGICLCKSFSGTTALRQHVLPYQISVLTVRKNVPYHILYLQGTNNGVTGALTEMKIPINQEEYVRVNWMW